jgi:two-component system LytT family sensor kinase
MEMRAWRSGTPGRGLQIGLYLAVWTLLGLFSATHSYLVYIHKGQAIPWYQAVQLGLLLWWAWGLLALGIFWFANRYPLEQYNWQRRLAVYALVAAFLPFVKIALDYPIIEACYCPDPGLMPIAKFLRMGFNSQYEKYVLICFGLLGISNAWRYYCQSRERELRTAQLEARLAQTELHLLKSQLQPHFLFNTLNTISALIYKDVDVADRMLARLGDLLRFSLDNAEQEEVTLQEELAFTRAYLEIEQVRFGDRLQVEWQIDSGTEDAYVPYLLLQPLAENAIKHGIRPHKGRGRIVISARRRRGWLQLQVSDNGPGLPPRRADVPEHVGLGNTRARLRQLYDDQHRLELGNGPLGGLTVSIEIPLALTGTDFTIEEATPGSLIGEA